MDSAGKRLAEAVRERRAELRRSQQGVRDRAIESGQNPVSVQTLRNVESAVSDNYRPDTLAALDAGLDWPDGTSRRILDGADAPMGIVEVAEPTITERFDQVAQDRREALIRVAVPAAKLTDAEALMVVLRCLSDDQYAMFARAVQADERFASAG